MPAQVRCDASPPVATLWLDQPARLNAMSRAMWGQLADGLERLADDPAVRCIVLRGAGGNFSPGNDISRFAEERASAGAARAYGVDLGRAFAALKACPVPLIAVIEGACIGGGLIIAGLCDIRLAADTARFGVPVGRLGLAMNHAELGFMLAATGRRTALEMLLEGRIWKAREAYEKGLVNRLVAADNLAGLVADTTRRIVEGAPLVARWHKKFIAEICTGLPLDASAVAEGYACYDSADFKAGLAAFLAGGKAEFEGR